MTLSQQQCLGVPKRIRISEKSETTNFCRNPFGLLYQQWNDSISFRGKTEYSILEPLFKDPLIFSVFRWWKPFCHSQRVRSLWPQDGSMGCHCTYDHQEVASWDHKPREKPLRCWRVSFMRIEPYSFYFRKTHYKNLFHCCGETRKSVMAFGNVSLFCDVSLSLNT